MKVLHLEIDSSSTLQTWQHSEQNCFMLQIMNAMLVVAAMDINMIWTQENVAANQIGMVPNVEVSQKQADS